MTKGARLQRGPLPNPNQRGAPPLLLPPTAKILCGHHNSALSTVDQAGIASVRTLADYIRALDSRTSPQSAHPEEVRFTIDGRLFERWILKLAINVACAARLTVGWSGGGARVCEPPSQVVAGVYGRSTLAAPWGLYVAPTPYDGLGVEFLDSYFFREIVITGLLYGMYVNYHGCGFVAWTAPAEPPDTIAFESISIPVLYHPMSLVMGCGNTHLAYQW